MSDEKLFFLIAGEASGDLLGARLIRAMLKKTNGTARFIGIGGPRMIAEGLDPFFPQEELAHMGLFEILRHIPSLLRRIRETVQEIKKQKPDALVTIDAPDFSFRVAKKLKGCGIPLIHYVAPTVWAWRPGRAKKMARFLDHLLVLLPFEPPYFTREGLACTFVGHPLVESEAGKGDAARFRARYEMAENQTLLAVLPGSRFGEMSRLLPIFEKTARLLQKKIPSLVVVIPTVPSKEDFIRASTKDWPMPVKIVTSDADKYDAFAASRAALACSGTVSVELAMAQLPAVIAYKMNPLTVALLRRFVKTKYVTLLNIMHGRAVMPEFLQEDCTPEKLSGALGNLLLEDTARLAQQAELAPIAAWLGRGQFIPSERAAEVVLNVAEDLSGKKKS